MLKFLFSNLQTYFAVGMSTNNNMLDTVGDTSEFQGSRFRCYGVRVADSSTWNEISCISYNEHITNVGFREPGWQHSTINASKENRSWLKKYKYESTKVLLSILKSQVYKSCTGDVCHSSIT